MFGVDPGHSTQARLHAFYEVNQGSGTTGSAKRSLDDCWEVLCRDQPGLMWYGDRISQKLPVDKHVELKIQRSYLPRDKLQQRWFGVNPFLLWDERSQTYLVGVRILNYAGKIPEEPMVAQGQIQTVYQVFVLDKDLKILRNFPLDLGKTRLIDRTWDIASGIEDLRVVPGPNGKFKGVCTGMEIHPAGPVRMGMFDLELVREENEVRGARVRNLAPLHGFMDHHQQKNWSPVFYEGEFHVLYHPTNTLIQGKWNPPLLLKPDGTGKIVERRELTNHTPLCHYKGGTPLIPFSKGFISVAHVSADRDRRVYYHRFLRYDEDLNLVGKSRLFHVFKPGTVEFITGLEIRGDRILLTLGFEDRTAHLISLDLAWLDWGMK